MKKIVAVIALTLFTINGFAQNKSITKATKISNEMTTVLSLNDEEKEKVYTIQLERFTKADKIREAHKDDKEFMKSELKKNINRLWGKLKATLGEERMKAWGTYKRNN